MTMDVERQSLSGRLREGFVALPEVRLAYLFGSRATGRARPDSDIDIAVLIDDGVCTDARHVNHVLRRVTGHVGGGDVPSDLLDVVLLNEAPVLLRHHVLRDGVLLYERDEGERVRFAAWTMRDYQDFERLLAFHRGWRIAHLKRAETKTTAKSWEPVRQTGQADGGRGDILAAARRAGRILGQAGPPR